MTDQHAAEEEANASSQHRLWKEIRQELRDIRRIPELIVPGLEPTWSCPRCGEAVKEDQEHCPGCGLDLDEKYEGTGYREHVFRHNSTQILVFVAAAIISFATIARTGSFSTTGSGIAAALIAAFVTWLVYRVRIRINRE